MWIAFCKVVFVYLVPSYKVHKRFEQIKPTERCGRSQAKAQVEVQTCAFVMRRLKTGNAQRKYKVIAVPHFLIDPGPKFLLLRVPSEVFQEYTGWLNSIDTVSILDTMTFRGTFILLKLIHEIYFLNIFQILKIYYYIICPMVD